MTHYIATRFSVPMTASGHGHANNRTTHCNQDWLRGRIDLFYRWYVPSVCSLGVDCILLCSRESRQFVEREVRALDWAHVEECNDWHAGWSAGEQDTVTRLDSDDALHRDWFTKLDFGDHEAIGSDKTYFLDPVSWRVYQRVLPQRRTTACIALRYGRNPFATKHSSVSTVYRTKLLEQSHVLQVSHGGNVLNRMRYNTMGHAISIFREVDPAIIDEFNL